MFSHREQHFSTTRMGDLCLCVLSPLQPIRSAEIASHGFQGIAIYLTLHRLTGWISVSSMETPVIRF